MTPPIQELLRDPTLALPALPYPYQQIGIKWLMDRDSALLADEMGLGKTMQAIIAARLLWREQKINRVLVVCPKTLIPNWKREIAQWWPSAIDNTMIIEQRPEFYLRLATDNVTIKIVNFERLWAIVDWIETTPFSHDLIIVDEAQRIKNAGTSSARAVRALKSTRRWALTGTPLENRVSDVVSIFGFVRPGLLRSDDTEHVREEIKPFMLRRRTEEVLKDLPEKDDQDLPVELLDRQRRAYERAEASGVVKLNEKGDTVTVQHVFALIQKLIQICNFDGESRESAKLERLTEDLEEIVASGRKVLVFSQWVSRPYGLEELAGVLPAKCGPSTPVRCVAMHGQVSSSQREVNIKAFSEDPATNVMLLNYRVGGVGLNLQAANYVYLFDRWWNPAVEDQAVKRAHRIGQQHKVFIRRYFARDTIEERILQKIDEKRRLFSHVIDSDKPTPEMMGLSEEEVFQLFKDLKVRPRRASQATGQVRLRLSEMSPAEFEELVARVYEALDFRVERRGGPNDQGIDLIAQGLGKTHKDHLRVAVQCKHVSENVGPGPVRELLGVLARDPSFNVAALVTSASFTAAAKQAASGHRIRLMSRTELLELAREYEVAEFE